MSLETELYKYLKADAAIAAAVSDRIYPMQAPTSAALPYVTYQRISDVPEKHLLAASSISRATIQIDCWGTGNISVSTVSEAIREALDGFRTSLMGTVEIRRVMLTNESETFEAPDDSSQVGTFRTRMDFDFWYRRSVPTFP